MLDYEMFKEVLEKMLMSFMPEKYQGYQVQIRKNQKVNRIIDTLDITPKEDAINAAGPSFSIQPFYEFYMECKNLQRVFLSIIEQAIEAIEKSPAILEKLDLKKERE